MPRIIGAVSVQIVRANFKISGYDSGNGITKWPPRAEATNKNYERGKTVNSSGTVSRYRSGKNSVYKGSVYSASKPLLLQTQNLFNSIAYRVAGKRVFIGTNLSIVPYAKAMNIGGRGIPARQYMPTPNQGANVKMLTAIRSKIDFETQKALKAFAK